MLWEGRGIVTQRRETLRRGLSSDCDAAKIIGEGVCYTSARTLSATSGVLEFEPDALQPSWTECHHCGLDNEIPPGLYDRPAIIQGDVPSRMM